MPATADVLKCQLRPLTSADRAHLTSEQAARLHRAFPTGVCDWKQSGVGQAPPMGTWLGFSGDGTATRLSR